MQYNTIALPIRQQGVRVYLSTPCSMYCIVWFYHGRFIVVLGEDIFHSHVCTILPAASKKHNFIKPQLVIFTLFVLIKQMRYNM